MTGTETGSGTSPAHLKRVGSGRVAVLFCVVIMVTHGFGNGLVPAFLPRIAEQLESGYGVLGLAVASGLMAYGLGAAIGVKVIDRFPLQAILLASLAVGAAGFLVIVWVDSAPALAGCVATISLVSPISWAVSVRLIASVVEPSSHGRVMSVAGAGAGAGGGVNGLFVLLFAEPGQWRWAFFIASAVAVLAALAAMTVLPGGTISGAGSSSGRPRAWREAWSLRAGRTVMLVSVALGVTGFPFISYMSATAEEEFMGSALAMAVLWWVASSVGLVTAVLAGLWSDRASPVLVIGVIALTYTTTLTFFAINWSYGGLLAAAIGFGLFNYPTWGLLGHLAGQRITEPALALRAVSGGLTGAAFFATGAVTLTGWWIDQAGTFRIPAIVLAGLGCLTAIWLASEYRREPRPS
ncbi:MAG: MFS transporter [bacterium]|nr:MFS transporter [bacterium]